MPTKEEKIEYIRQKCIEANPSIKDLVFGCEISWQYTHSLNTKSKVERVKKGIFVNYGNGNLRNPLPMNVLFYGNSTVKSVSKEEVTIIGRPIRLADVLLAINKVEKAWLGDWVINSRGHFVKQYINGLHVAEAARYNFLKDSLSDQDEACIDFLYELLHG